MLKREGYIWDWEEVASKPANQLRVHLKYGPNGERVIRRIRRVSKPGRRVYSGAADLKPVLGGLGICDHQHQPRRDQRPRGPAAETRRRSALRNLVSSARRPVAQPDETTESRKAELTMSRIGKKPVRRPRRREGPGRRPHASPSKARWASSSGSTAREVAVAYDDAGQDRHRRRGSDDERQSRALHGLTRAADPEHDRRRDARATRSGWRSSASATWPPCRARRCSCASASPTKFASADPRRAEGHLSPTRQHIVIQGIDKQKVGQFAAEVRAVRKPEPYKGKGIRYDGRSRSAASKARPWRSNAVRGRGATSAGR